MPAPDTWTGAIIRGRDGRKGRVTAHLRVSVLRSEETFIVDWEDGAEGYYPRAHATMLRPPIGYVPATRAQARLPRRLSALRALAAISGAFALLLGILALWADIAL